MGKNGMIGILAVIVIILLAAFLMRGPSQPNSAAPVSSTPPAVAPPATK
ncbi:Hypothetical protein NGAL_HAMBI2427_36210 [Neorhizobium galegae bv. orientalis]|nr:Hypothetical protein NGAL_HAMBI2427_36210 [Neorhizobium galegae bv. orientalis]